MIVTDLKREPKFKIFTRPRQAGDQLYWRLWNDDQFCSLFEANTERDGLITKYPKRDFIVAKNFITIATLDENL